MWKTSLKTFLVELCLFGLGLMTVPNWIADNVHIWLPAAFALLLVMMCRENWPHFIARLERLRWVNQSDGLKLFRDNIDDRGELAGMIDFWDGSKEGLFLQYMREGLNENNIKATGIPKNGLKRRRIPLPVRNSNVEDTVPDRTITGADDRIYEDLHFDRLSVINYAKTLKRRS